MADAEDFFVQNNPANPFDLHAMISERVQNEMAAELEQTHEDESTDSEEGLPREAQRFLCMKLLEVSEGSEFMTKAHLQKFTSLAYPNREPEMIELMVNDLCAVNNWTDSIDVGSVIENYEMGWMEAPAVVYQELINLGFQVQDKEEDSDGLNQEGDYQLILENWISLLEKHEELLKFAETKGKINREAIADFCHPSWFDITQAGCTITEQNFVSYLEQMKTEIQGVCLFTAPHVDFSLSLDYLQNLRVLSLRESATDDSLQKVLTCCKNLIALDINVDGLSAKVLLNFFSCTRELLYLRCDSYDNTELSAEMLACLPKLTHLVCYTTDAVIAGLVAHNPRLEFLKCSEGLHSTVSHDVFASFIASRPKIKFENFDGYTRINTQKMSKDQIVKTLRRRPNMIQEILIFDFDLISHLPQALRMLTAISLDEKVITTSQMKGIGLLSQLEVLSLPQCIPPWGFIHDAEIPLLLDCLVQSISKLRHLKEVDVSHTGITIDTIQLIKTSTSLKKLIVDECIGQGGAMEFMRQVRGIAQEAGDFELIARYQYAPEYSIFYEDLAIEKLKNLGLKLPISGVLDNDGAIIAESAEENTI